MDPVSILTNAPKILIKQQIELMEVINGIETNNKYAICDHLGQPFLHAIESTNCCSRICCCEDRAFTIDIEDKNGSPVACIRRDCKCNLMQCCSCISCCQDRIAVEFPPGRPIGSVCQEATCCTINYTVRDVSDETVMYLKGPSYCLCVCPGTVHFIDILTPDQSRRMGQLKKVWSDLLQELMTDADNFEVEFAPQMPIEHKMLLIGATLLFDFMFFENTGKGRRRGFR